MSSCILPHGAPPVSWHAGSLSVTYMPQFPAERAWNSAAAITNPAQSHHARRRCSRQQARGWAPSARCSGTRRRRRPAASPPRPPWATTCSRRRPPRCCPASAAAGARSEANHLCFVVANGREPMWPAPERRRCSSGTICSRTRRPCCCPASAAAGAPETQIAPRRCAALEDAWITPHIFPCAALWQTSLFEQTAASMHVFSFIEEVRGARAQRASHIQRISSMLSAWQTALCQQTVTPPSSKPPMRSSGAHGQSGGNRSHRSAGKTVELCSRR